VVTLQLLQQGCLANFLSYYHLCVPIKCLLMCFSSMLLFGFKLSARSSLFCAVRVLRADSVGLSYPCSCINFVEKKWT